MDADILQTTRKAKRSAPEDEPFRTGYATLLWLFMFGSVAGFVLEGLWCVLTDGRWESHTATVWVPFCIIYGIGAVAVYLLSGLLKGRSLPVQFAAFTLSGAAVEFFGSLFQELCFGSVSWDYSAHLLNLGGRVSLKMALMWGAMGAAVATLASYIVIFAARAIHSRTLLKVSFSVPRFLAAMAVLVFECFLVEGERTAESVLCCAAVALLYVRPLIKAARSGFREILPRRPR